MKKKITSESFLKLFREICEKHNKMCIPDSPREDSISVSLLVYYKKNYDVGLLIEALDLYVKELGHKPAMLLEFSLVAHEYRDRVMHNRRLDEEFKATLANTKKLLEGS